MFAIWIESSRDFKGWPSTEKSDERQIILRPSPRQPLAKKVSRETERSKSEGHRIGSRIHDKKVFWFDSASEIGWRNKIDLPDLQHSMPSLNKQGGGNTTRRWFNSLFIIYLLYPVNILRQISKSFMEIAEVLLVGCIFPQVSIALQQEGSCQIIHVSICYRQSSSLLH